MREYYSVLYNMVITHFRAYCLTSTGLFKQDVKSVSTLDKAVGIASILEPLIKKIPFIGDLVEIPFQIASFVKEQKSENLNKVIADKINRSVLISE